MQKAQTQSNRRKRNLAILATFSIALILASTFYVSENSVQISISTDFECPAKRNQDRERSERIISLLKTSDVGRNVLEHTKNPLKICYGEEHIPAIMANQVFLLDERHSDRESAARLGHLLVHMNEGLPFDEKLARAGRCDELVEKAVRAEARAHSVELQLRRELNVTEPQLNFPFEQEFWLKQKSKHIGFLIEYFYKNAGGQEGSVGFVNAYSYRCKNMSKER